LKAFYGQVGSVLGKRKTTKCGKHSATENANTDSGGGGNERMGATVEREASWEA